MLAGSTRMDDACRGGRENSRSAPFAGRRLRTSVSGASPRNPVWKRVSIGSSAGRKPGSWPALAAGRAVESPVEPLGVQGFLAKVALEALSLAGHGSCGWAERGSDRSPHPCYLARTSGRFRDTRCAGSALTPVLNLRLLRQRQVDRLRALSEARDQPSGLVDVEGSDPNEERIGGPSELPAAALVRFAPPSSSRGRSNSTTTPSSRRRWSSRTRPNEPLEPEPKH